MNEGIKKTFYIKDKTDLEKILNEMIIENEGYLTWGEFVELMFRHKRRVNPPEYMPINIEREIEAKSRHDIKPILKQIPIEEVKHKPLTANDYKKQYKKPKKKDEDIKITIPKPFNFDERDKQKKKKIAVPLESPHEENYEPFRANPIPVSTLLPKYEMIVAKNEARRLEVKQTSYAVTKAREKPFSFYEKDKDKYLNRMNADDKSKIQGKQFKANPLPPHVSVQLYEQMVRERETKRDERIKKHAEESLAKSKLPPRMEMDTIKNKPVQKLEDQYKFKPEPAKPLPDFNKQYEEFKRALDKHKQEKKPTNPNPFNFTETKAKAKAYSDMDIKNKQISRDRPKLNDPRNIPALNTPQVNPPTTLKLTQATELREKKAEEERKRNEQLKQEEQKRKERLKEVIALLKVGCTQSKK